MKRHLLLLTLLVLTGGYALGQGNGYHEEVRVVKSYNPMIDDAFKININPVITDTAVTREPLRYEITPMKLSTDIEISPIRAARMSGMPQSELYRLFLKSGFGNYTTPYFEAFYNSLRSRRSSYGMHYKHLSSYGKLPGYAFPGYSENTFDLNASLFGQSHVFSFNGAYNRDVVHFYGRPDTLVNDTLDKESIRQRFHSVSVDAAMRSNYFGSDRLNHGIGLGYRMINDLYNTTEHNIKFDGYLNKAVTWFSFSRYQTPGLDVKGDIFNTRMAKDTTEEILNQAIVLITPYIQSRIKDMDIRVGGTLGYESENNGTLHFFPDVRLKISLSEQKFILNAGLDGGMERSSFALMADENPFIISDPEMRNTITKIRVYGGIRTAIGSRLNFTARVSSESVSNYAMFVADTALPFRNRFGVIYDDGTILSLKAELTYQAAEKIKIGGRLLYQDFNMNTEGYAWHKPAFTSGIDIRYNLEDKIIAYAGLNYLADIKVKTFEDGKMVTGSLKNILDINFGAEYRYSKLLSGFLRLNNLAASKYYRWQHYPAHRFNMMIGVTYAL